MKKILRTKLEYNCNKYEDFCYIDRKYKMVYDRSYDLTVTASTEEECWNIMDNFEEYIRAKGVQDTFDSNLAPSLNEDGLWVGTVEVYINNDYVTEEKERVKEVYKEWKKIIKTSSVNAIKKKEEVNEFKELEEKLVKEESFRMEYEINLVKEEIKAYEVLANSTIPEDGYYLERRTAKIWDTLEDMLKGYIPMKEYNELYNQWRKVVNLVYSNKNLCIC